MRELPLGIKNERRLKALTGLTYEKYELLLSKFSEICSKYDAEIEAEKERKRAVGGGRKNALPTYEIRLLFVLYYLKAYPTFDLLGDRFNMASSTANTRLHKLMPFLTKSLTALNVMPKRSFETPEELKEYLESLGGIESILIDVTEREYFRYQNEDKRDALYSGKKKDLPLKTPS